MKGFSEFSKSSKSSKSIGLLVSAAIVTLWSGTAQAANPEQVDRASSSVNNSPVNSLVNFPAVHTTGAESLELGEFRKSGLVGITNASPAQAPLEIGASEIGISEIGAIAELEATNPNQVPNNISLPSTANVIASGTNNSTANITANSTELPLESINSFTSINPSINLTDSINPANNLDLSAVSTSAGDLAPEPTESILAQEGLPRRVAPFTPTSYVGIGLNLGLSDDGSALGQSRFLFYGKLGITPEVSFRPAILLGNDTTFLLPITYDFPLQPADAIQPTSFVPYLGGGAIIATGSGDSDIGFLLSGGIDLPISRDFTATAGLNVGFIRSNTDFGILLGVAYNISGFRF